MRWGVLPLESGESLEREIWEIWGNSGKIKNTRFFA